MSIFEERYCPKHNRTFHGFRCPQCIEDDKKERFEKVLEPLKKAEQKREAQEQLHLILAHLEKATLVKDTADYKLSICPVCNQKSLFFLKSNGMYECLNHKGCGLNSTIRLLTEQSKR
jgi:uncharacterized protein (DUF1499 family)